jgi:hypothetical protein
MPAVCGFFHHDPFITAGFWPVKRKIHRSSRKTRRAELHFGRASKAKPCAFTAAENAQKAELFRVIEAATALVESPPKPVAHENRAE